MTLIRVLLSWVMAVVLCLLVPSFIAVTAEERRNVFDPVNLGLKVVGSVGITISLFIVNRVFG